jgi:hypothetical protein
MKSLKKKPIQIYIEPQQDYVLENLARKRGISKAEIIRKSLDKFLREIPLEEDPGMGLIGLGKSGKRDLSDHYDKYLTKYVRQNKRR